MDSIYSILKAPVITEKSTSLGMVGNKFAFWVDPRAGKNEIKEAVERIFNVKVLKVNTERVPGKLKRMGKYAGKTPVRKKAYLTLKEGDTIEIFEGVR